MTAEDQKSMEEARGFNRIVAVYTVLLSGVILAWVFIQIRQTMNPDSIWLSEALRRYLFDGQSTIEGWFEPNPPLVVFMNTIPVLLREFAGLPLYYTVFIQTLLLVFISTGAVWIILRGWLFLSRADRLILITALLSANTILADNMAGERDHWAALGLVPFALIQIALTFNLPRPSKRFMWLICLCGGLLIILKPHFGLLPALLIAHRLIRQRRRPNIRDIDFIALALVTSLYITGILLLFPGYITDILPFVLYGYLPLRDDAAVLLMLAQYIPACLVLTVLFLKTGMSREQRYLGYFLVLAALVNLVPYYVQGKGYAYHLLPANSFLWMAMGFWIWLCLRNQATVWPALFLSAVFITGGAFAAHSFRDPDLTHQEYRNLPLVRMASGCGNPVCHIFIFSIDLETVQKISFYANARHASRFPIYWPLPPVLLARAEGIPQPPAESAGPSINIDAYRQEFGRMTAEDLAHYKPFLLMIARLKILKGHEAFDFSGFFSASADFKREWANYKKIDTVTVPYAAYHAGTLRNKDLMLEYDIYKRMRNGDVK